MMKVFLTIHLLLLPISVISEHLDSERTILLSIKKQWGNPQPLSTWQPATSPCSWYGIHCSATNVVTGILLPYVSFCNHIPASVCLLQNLTTLDLSSNNITGGFPTHLYSCSSLTHLNLSMNNFVGHFPDDIHKLSSLRHLDLSCNNFTGDVPKSIGLLSQLRTFNITYNLLDGTFPAEIGNLSKLVYLRMPWNPFTPIAIPSEWGRLKKLKYLYMVECNLVGEIPVCISEMESLQVLDLVGNHLVGRIPRSIMMLKDLRCLFLYKNNLTGPIPRPVQCLNLTDLDLSDNRLSGAIPEEVGNLTKLKVLQLFNNNLTGSIPSNIGLLPELTTIALFHNNFSGTLPPELGLHSALGSLDVAENFISGHIPEHLCSNGVFIGIAAFSNKLSGEIPRSFENCSALLSLMLYNNSLTGEFPSGIWTSPNLLSLMLSNNELTGQLPPHVPSTITRIEIDNMFSGEIPASIGSWENIEGNQLSGKLPTKITSWSNLEKLDISRNELSGPLPATFGSLTSLIYLDLSENHLSGHIPPQYQHVSLTFLNLSNNGLFGQIPSAFDNGAFAKSFLNTTLCAPERSEILSLPQCSIPSTSSSSSSSSHLPNKYLATILVVAILVVVVTLSALALYCAIKKMRQQRDNKEPESWNLTSFERLKFSETDIISNLLESNVVGSGGSGKVYRVQLGNLGFSVAVKQMWKSPNLVNAQFLAEVRILASIRHINIVRLLCCIWSDSSKLLVYEYLENQGLDKWLHGRRRSESEGDHVLEWPTRLKIAIAAAQGLCYMHHDCSPPVIHRDIKSSNILLDSEFNAKIADFGLAKMWIREGELQTLSNVAGTFGYLAPEYVHTTRVNEKVDVYSFGVVLLELATGKEAVRGDENLAQWSRKQCGEDKTIKDALDVEVLQDDYIEEMSNLFKLGLLCTSSIPTSRPSMKDVLLMLNQLTPARHSQEDHVVLFDNRDGGTLEDGIEMV